ncbi:MAG: M20/M25/M40 family metallo-hydrolase [Anaerolineae bacterium]|nr:M20/M25/M40 family metallo-hydrolase [Anaerolineae bacterium]
MDLKAHLTRLCQAHGPSGYEGPVRDIVREEWAALTDELTVDPLGSLVGLKRGSGDEPRRRIMLAAHMDEIGMLVSEIDGAFIRVRNIRGLDARVMVAQPVLVHGKEPLPGMVASTPPHLLPADKRDSYLSVEDLIIDVGLSAEVVADLVSVGDPVTVDVPLLELHNGRVAGKAMDDRACVAAVTACLHELQKRQHVWDVAAVATVQEEVGLRGATTAAHFVDPDAAIALDVTFGKQPGVGDAENAVAIGSGPALGLGANFHPKLYDSITAAAKRLEMSINIDPMPGRSGTDAWAIQVARSGIPTALLSVPIRNMHSPIELADLDDIRRAGRLLAEFIAGLDADFLSTIAWDDPLAEKDAEGDAKA